VGGAVLPRARVPLKAPLGIGVDIRAIDTHGSSLDKVITTDALIVSQPKGEIDKVHAAMVDMAEQSAVLGLIAGSATVGAAVGLWNLVGARRRAEIRSSSSGKLASRTAVGVAAITAFTPIVAPLLHVDAKEGPVSTWKPVSNYINLGNVVDASQLSDLKGMEIESGAIASRSLFLLNKGFQTYASSKAYYGNLVKKVQETPMQLHQPRQGDLVAVFVTDRHDNIGMDPVARAIADKGGASMLIDAGDDTSSGGGWETFSIDSLASNFKGFKTVAIPGNHDHGAPIPAAYKDRGFTVLTGHEVTVNGINFLGDGDPRRSGLDITSGIVNVDGTVTEQGDVLKQKACQAGDVAVLLTHSPAAARATVDAGCTELAINGHYHRQVGPFTTTHTLAGPDGSTETLRSTIYTSTSTGGAAESLALGRKLGIDAAVTLITFRDGHPIGLQPVVITTDTQIEVQPYDNIGNLVAFAKDAGVTNGAARDYTAKSTSH
jgi:hypothetical protein